MSELENNVIREKIFQRLENPVFNLKDRENNEFLFSNKQIMIEQYKLLIDSAHKIEERRSASNNIFLGVNTLLVSFLVRPSQLTSMTARDIPLLIVLAAIGMFISWDWLKVTASYKMLNSVNYYMIQAVEKLLPMFMFSLRAEIEAEQGEKKASNRGNTILVKENLMQKAFLCFYIVYFFTILSCLYLLL
jgi:hypothetical protein